MSPKYQTELANDGGVAIAADPATITDPVGKNAAAVFKQISDKNGLGFYPPGPPSEPAGSPLGDALNALAAAVDCARRNFGHGPEMTWPLLGRLGLARFLMPAPAS